MRSPHARALRHQPAPEPAQLQPSLASGSVRAPLHSRPAIPQPMQGAHFAALQKLQIPTFLGDKLDRQGFWDHIHHPLERTLNMHREVRVHHIVLDRSRQGWDRWHQAGRQRLRLCRQSPITRFGWKGRLVDDHKLLALIR